jgi:hypothetical protein
MILFSKYLETASTAERGAKFMSSDLALEKFFISIRKEGHTAYYCRSSIKNPRPCQVQKIFSRSPRHSDSFLKKNSSGAGMKRRARGGHRWGKLPLPQKIIPGIINSLFEGFDPNRFSRKSVRGLPFSEKLLSNLMKKQGSEIALMAFKR